MSYANVFYVVELCRSWWQW